MPNGTGYECHCGNGYTGKNCELSSTMNFQGSGYWKFNSTQTSVIFRFRSTLLSGILAVLQYGSSYILLTLQDGRLALSTSNNSSVTLFPNALNDGKWHHVTFSVQSNSISVISDRISKNVSGVLITDVKHHWFGGIDSSAISSGPALLFPGFVGCMQDISLGGTIQIASKGIGKNVVAGNCTRKEVCAGDPCGMFGTCQDFWTKFSCICNTRYYGKTCNQGKSLD